MYVCITHIYDQTSKLDTHLLWLFNPIEEDLFY